ncbi:aminopeptidase [Photobacterium jeanii]|uniref:Aminopeptidase n=1 Tax=Photobacterium jeanii TaxID=858640 RepID=A0A178KRE0_9GAMM|nr:DUF3630 family protein [Photobacterium jeanii]OAN19183.1 aminopeptidase [Photobacterium jeanii]PST87190.1 DUF3630 domain-containing protein [Photobacterium jeanii]
MAISSSPFFAVRRLDLASGHLMLIGPDFDFDSFAAMAEALLLQIDATVVEKELNADLHVWLIDFEGCQLLLKGEHYSGAVWIEAMSTRDNETLAFIASLLPQDDSQVC